MKIKNDYVDIKIGKKTYQFRNMIFNNYIQYLIDRSIDTTKTSLMCPLKAVYIKLDTPITNYDYDTELNTNQFDFWFAIGEENFEQELSKTEITATYNFRREQSETVLSINDNTRIRYLSFFNGRKICNIGFGFSPEWYFSSYSENTAKIGAIVDTSSYNIYIQSDEILSILRKDIITTDGIFRTNIDKKFKDIYDYEINEDIRSPLHYYYAVDEAPAHLTPALLESRINPSQTSCRCSGLLYSVSPSNDGISKENEYIIGTDINITKVGNAIEFDVISNIKNDYVSYLGDTYLSYSYLGKPTYKYMILKYKIMQLVDSIATDTGYYYTLTVPIDKIGNLKFKINYERGE